MPDRLSKADNAAYSEISWLRRLRSSFGILSDWLNLICLLFALGTAIWSVERAQWVRPSPSFMAIFILAVISGFILAKSRLRSYIAHIISVAVALAVLFCQGLLLVSGNDLLTRTMNFVSNIQDWWYSQVNSIPATNTLHIALIFSFLTWIIAYFSTWPLIRKRNPWIAILFGTVVILLNLNFLTSDKHYYFVIFLAGALALIAMTTYTRNNSGPAATARSGKNWVAKVWAASAACLIIVAVSITWVSPGFRIPAIADYSRANSPFQGTFKLFWQNFFATVPGSGSPVLEHGGQKELKLGGALELTDQVDYIIRSDFPTLWKTQIYDYYDFGTWKATDVDSEFVYTGSIESSPSQEGLLSYTVIPQVDTDVIPSTGNFVSGSVTMIEKTMSPEVFDIDIMSPSSIIQLPADISGVAKSMLSVNLNELRNSRLLWLRSMLPSDLELVDVKWERGDIRVMSVARRMPEIKDAIALSSANVVEHQQPVAVTAKVPLQFSIDDLRSDNSANYPLQITDRYLQLPPNYPARVKGLTTNIIQYAGNQYDKVQAIINYLKDYPYNLEIDAPPPEADAVDFFLFGQKSGYCSYYASALAVMLRSEGIPARLVVGFAPGQYDPKTHSYIIRDRDYHAWTEVYFPARGWVAFDPTPSTSGESADYLQYYSLPGMANYSNQSATGVHRPSESPKIDFGRYVGLSAGIIAGMIVILLIAFCVWIYRQPKNHLGMYLRMIILSWLAGIGPKRWQTALEYSNNLSASFPRSANGINRIIREYAVMRYSVQHAEVSPPDELEESWPLIRNNLIKRALRIDWLLE